MHWDHIQGLPFFEPAYVPGTSISIYAQRAAADELQQVISGITRHEFFPMPLASVPADFEFLEVDSGTPVTIGEFHVMPILLNHPFGAVGYRISVDGTSLAYMSDTAPFTEVLHKQHFLSGPEALSDDDRVVLAKMRADVVEHLTGTHTVVYDTHFLPDEYAKFPHYGHSTPDHAIATCMGIGVSRLVLYHHAPSHSDEMMDEIARTYAERGQAAGLEVVTAQELMTLAVGTGSGE